jgi:hypothetical protein
MDNERHMEKRIRGKLWSLLLHPKFILSLLRHARVRFVQTHHPYRRDAMELYGVLSGVELLFWMSLVPCTTPIPSDNLFPLTPFLLSLLYYLFHSIYYFF